MTRARNASSTTSTSAPARSDQASAARIALRAAGLAAWTAALGSAATTATAWALSLAVSLDGGSVGMDDEWPLPPAPGWVAAQTAERTERWGVSRWDAVRDCLPADLLEPGRAGVLTAAWSAGLPLPALAAEEGLAAKSAGATAPLPGWRGGLRLPAAVRHPSRVPSLPTRPLWPGFAVDAALLGAVLALGPRAARRLRRRFRTASGRCPRCAHPRAAGQGARCPECGAAGGR